MVQQLPTTINATKRGALINPPTPEQLGHLESLLYCRLNRRVRHLRLTYCDEGLVLQGCAATYHAKQIALHALMEATTLPIAANDIEVS